MLALLLFLDLMEGFAHVLILFSEWCYFHTAMVSRQTLDPPITVEQLNSYVLNVVPDRDLIASIDDPGNLHQRIE